VNYVSFFDAVRSPHAASGMLVCFRGRFAGLGRNSGQSNRKTNDSSRTACRQQLNPFFPKPQQRCFARRRFRWRDSVCARHGGLPDRSRRVGAQKSCAPTSCGRTGLKTGRYMAASFAAAAETRSASRCRAAAALSMACSASFHCFCSMASRTAGTALAS
jgi:hypothetical protein